MTLTILLNMLIPVFLVPAILLPHNKLRLYTLCSSIAAIFVSFFLFLNFFAPDIHLVAQMGNFFLPMWKPFLYAKELSTGDINHLSFTLTMGMFYGLVYFISFIIIKKFYIGTNPDIHRPISTIARISSVFLFFIFTYIAVFLFLVNIRFLLPLRDGFFSPFFAWIYPLEA